MLSAVLEELLELALEAEEPDEPLACVFPLPEEPLLAFELSALLSSWLELEASGWLLELASGALDELASLALDAGSLLLLELLDLSALL